MTDLMGSGRRSGPGRDHAEEVVPSARRRQLAAVAAELFARQGYRSTTVRQITDAAGVLSGSLHHHFESREAVLDEFLSDYFQDLLADHREIAQARTDTGTKIRRLVAAAIGPLKEHHADVVVLHSERRELAQLPHFAFLEDTEDEVRRLWTHMIREGITTGTFRDDLDPKILYQVVRDAISVTIHWFPPDRGMTPEELTDRYLDGVAVTESA